ncbi:tryptophan 2,3-dioxygenase family protein [Streptomyces sp. NBC_01351]|uniref:tryptophan 2,3-dioxygenase family protein n=1 Tax=Streptomyces sp. NBC_01351 TaxID=2903833 RepID=UPI002E332A81|nr:tryptophan 2,3-dioxygenase family protein [Streptomyces sp. NBC_01351]
MDEERRTRGDGIHLARLVTEQVQRTGKHFLPQPFLNRLSGIRSDRATEELPFLRAFLNCLLDKHDGHFWNRTYLSLPLLELIVDDSNHALGPNELATLLICDVLRFETRAAAGASGPVDRDPPEEAILRRRLRHAMRFVSDDLVGAGADEVADLLPGPPATDAGRWFDVTVQPVYVLHDEYFFIRALQAHEMLFTAIVADVRAAIAALRDGSAEAGAGHVDRAAGLFDRASTLFRMVATMRPAHFSAFRQFTQGASAIQSEQYKRFEILCGIPPAERLRSAPFTSVPAVRAEAVESSHDTVVRAYVDLRRRTRIREAERNLLHASLGRLEARHQRWKAAHRSLAARMLGDARGSGHTEGVPYLTQCLANRLFWQLGDRNTADGSACPHTTGTASPPHREPTGF